jgi:hypothetical protein
MSKEVNFHELFEATKLKAAAQAEAARTSLTELVAAKTKANLVLLYESGGKGEEKALANYQAALQAVEQCEKELARIEEADRELTKSYESRKLQEAAALKTSINKAWERKWDNKFAPKCLAIEAAAENLAKVYGEGFEIWNDLIHNSPVPLPMNQLNFGGFGKSSWREGFVGQALYRACHDIVQRNGLAGSNFALPSPQYDQVNSLGCPNNIPTATQKLANIRKTCVDYIWGRTVPDAPVGVREADVLADIDSATVEG